jgi:hypothetical protein
MTLYRVVFNSNPNRLIGQMFNLSDSENFDWFEACIHNDDRFHVDDPTFLVHVGHRFMSVQFLNRPSIARGRTADVELASAEDFCGYLKNLLDICLVHGS